MTPRTSTVDITIISASLGNTCLQWFGANFNNLIHDVSAVLSLIIAGLVIAEKIISLRKKNTK
jgi:hypothetical protein